MSARGSAIANKGDSGPTTENVEYEKMKIARVS